ncbi:hypothetical protein BED41_10450 [Cloacibacillus porcorum]|uniref:Uncharacterized protein n=2 Tax=Cloacibacillus porcorum TaxID=1197717 RepID=A0A1B2I643_9BACT|nr:hypothetical protein [Cloacibacillus porcorum]ANZ45449.1 hypothetical protein BED41_10450 [Cloacibacillus porcorum]
MTSDYKLAAQAEVVRPLYLLRILNIPPLNQGPHKMDDLYLTDAAENVMWFDKNRQPQSYTACAMRIEEAERSKEQTTDQCHISIDNVTNEFTSLAQYYKLNGVRCEVYRGFKEALNSETGAALVFSGKIRSITIGQTQVDAVVSQGFDGMDYVPRRICWTSMFPYIPSAKDPRELTIRK